MPFGVNVSMVSVTTSARPSRIVRKRSPSGTAQSRWSHGPYFGLKWTSTSQPLPSNSFLLTQRMRRRARRGKRWLRPYMARWRKMFLRRVIA